MVSSAITSILGITGVSYIYNHEPDFWSKSGIDDSWFPFMFSLNAVLILGYPILIFVVRHESALGSLWKKKNTISKT